MPRMCSSVYRLSKSHSQEGKLLEIRWSLSTLHTIRKFQTYQTMLWTIGDGILNKIYCFIDKTFHSRFQRNVIFQIKIEVSFTHIPLFNNNISDTFKENLAVEMQDYMFLLQTLHRRSFTLFWWGTSIAWFEIF